MAMKIANIAELKSKISEYLSAVENGEEIEVRKRNLPIAQCVFSASRITLPVGVQAVDIFDSKGRILWGYQRPDGITGVMILPTPQEYRTGIIVIRYSSNN